MVNERTEGGEWKTCQGKGMALAHILQTDTDDVKNRQSRDVSRAGWIMKGPGKGTRHSQVPDKTRRESVHAKVVSGIPWGRWKKGPGKGGRRALTELAVLLYTSHEVRVTAPPSMRSPPPCSRTSNGHSMGAMEQGSRKRQMASTHSTGSIRVHRRARHRHSTTRDVESSTLHTQE